MCWPAARGAFLDAVVSRPDTWRIILERMQELVRWTIERSALPRDLDVELAGRAIQSLAEEAGRMVLTDAETHGPARYETFVRAVTRALVAGAQEGAF